MTSQSPSSRSYWIIQAIAWSIHGVIGFSIHASFGGDSSQNALIAVIGSLLLFSSTHCLRMLTKRYHWEKLSIPKLSIRILGITLPLALASQLLISSILIWGLNAFTIEQFSFKVLSIYVFQTETLLILWTALYFGIIYFRNYKQAEIEKWRLEAIAKEAEINSLKSQLNPHFIFNCLNNIRALILEDSDRARDMINRLSDLLRYIFHYSQEDSVTIDREIAVVNDYLSLESIQLENRLQYSTSIADETRELLIPPMTIQLLAENSIKHGISQLPKGGKLTIDTRITDSHLKIQVVNTGQLESAAKNTTSVGLNNLRQRLTFLCGEEATFDLKNLDTNSVSAEITLPIPVNTADTTPAAQAK